jgi:hypothetical protein
MIQHGDKTESSRHGLSQQRMGTKLVPIRKINRKRETTSHYALPRLGRGGLRESNVTTCLATTTIIVS